MTDLHGRQVLVTGAGGFIGSHLVERLLADGALRYEERPFSFGYGGAHPGVLTRAEDAGGWEHGPPGRPQVRRMQSRRGDDDGRAGHRNGRKAT